MTRVRFDPYFFTDPRWERLGADAFILHQCACAYVVSNLTDGFVSTSRAPTLAPGLVKRPKTAIAALLDDGLWTPTDGGYKVCVCLDNLRTSAGRGDEQPSRAYVEGERERLARNKAAWAERQRKQKVADPGIDSLPTITGPVEESIPNHQQTSTDQYGTGTTSPVPVPMSSLVAATGRTDDEPGKASGPSRDPEECTRRGLEQLVKDRGLGVDVDELLGFAYDLNDDPWRGYLLIKALTEKGLGANRAATVRSRIARAIRENAGAA